MSEEESKREPSEEIGYQSTFWEGQGIIQDSSLQDVPISKEQHNRTSSVNSSVTIERMGEEYLLDPTKVALVSVGNPEKHGEGFKDAFYPNEGNNYTVRRRYQDFMWLLGKLSEEFEMGTIIPPIPEKNRLGFMDRFSPEFIRKRQQGLERFLNRALIHPRLSNNPSLQSFLTQPVLGIDEVSRIPKLESPTGMAAVVEHLSDAVVNVFSKTRHVDERFIMMKKTSNIAEGHLEKITNLHGRLAFTFRGLSEALMSSGSSLSQVSSSLGRMEKIVGAEMEEGERKVAFNEQKPLRTTLGDYGQLLEERSAITALMGEDMDIKVHLILSELGQYCRSAKQALRLRDQKQNEWEDLAEHLTSTREEYAFLSGDVSKVEEIESSSRGERLRVGKSKVVSFISEKIDSLRGIDPITARTERLKKLEQSIKELEETLESSKCQSNTIDKILEREYFGFLAILNREFKGRFVPGISTTWQNFHHQELNLWNNFSKDTLDYEPETESSL